MLKERFNLIFAITFILTLLAAGASAGPYIAKVSFAQLTHYPQHMAITFDDLSTDSADQRN
jgi:hypothetical protein